MKRWWIRAGLRTKSARYLAGTKKNKPRYGTPKKKRGISWPQVLKQYHSQGNPGV